MDQKVCSKCKIPKNVKEFSKRGNGPQKGKPDAYCKKCRWTARNEQNKQNLKDWKLYRGGKCIICGYDKCLAALDWHHRDPTKKEKSMQPFLLAKRCDPSYVRFLETVEELDKCDLVCANCHREIHHGVHPYCDSTRRGGLVSKSC